MIAHPVTLRKRTTVQLLGNALHAQRVLTPATLLRLVYSVRLAALPALVLALINVTLVIIQRVIMFQT